MITFEESLGKIVQLLPNVTIGVNNYPINYNWGTQELLNKYLIKNKENSYPLIWLIVGRDSNDIYNKNIPLRRFSAIRKSAQQLILRKAAAFRFRHFPQVPRCEWPFPCCHA